MKNKFERLSKEEKKQAIKDYGEKYPESLKGFNGMRIVGIFGLIYGSLMFAADLIWKELMHTSVWSFIIDGFLVVFCVVLLVARERYLNKLVNSFLINRDSSNKENNNKKNKKKA